VGKPGSHVDFVAFIFGIRYSTHTCITMRRRRSIPEKVQIMSGDERKRNPTSSRGNRQLSRLESAIGYRFVNRRLLAEALTHRSFVYQSRRHGLSDNERLEFLGDAVLGLIVSGRLLELFPESDEGSLSRMKASRIGAASLAGIADGIRLGEFLRLGRAEENTGGRTKRSVLANSFEALVAAVYLDSGISSAESLVLRLFGPLLERKAADGDARDYKTMLQELSHSLHCTPPCYIVRDITGPDHDLTFTVTVMVGDEYFATGTGGTRKEAEQCAAREALQLLEDEQAGRTAGGEQE
jgi:ribonuclease-3